MPRRSRLTRRASIHVSADIRYICVLIHTGTIQVNAEALAADASRIFALAFKVHEHSRVHQVRQRMLTYSHVCSRMLKYTDEC